MSSVSRGAGILPGGGKMRLPLETIVWIATIGEGRPTGVELSFAYPSLCRFSECPVLRAQIFKSKRYCLIENLQHSNSDTEKNTRLLRYDLVLPRIRGSSRHFWMTCDFFLCFQMSKLFTGEVRAASVFGTVHYVSTAPYRGNRWCVVFGWIWGVCEAYLWSEGQHTWPCIHDSCRFPNVPPLHATCWFGRDQT